MPEQEVDGSVQAPAASVATGRSVSACEPTAENKSRGKQSRNSQCSSSMAHPRPAHDSETFYDVELACFDARVFRAEGASAASSCFKLSPCAGESRRLGFARCRTYAIDMYPSQR